MKTLKMSSDQYENIVYLACATTAADDLQQLRLASKVLDKLEHAGVRKPDGVGYRLIDDSCTISFEDVEAEFVCGRVEAMVPQIQAWKAREVLGLVDQLTTDVTEEVEAT